MDPRVASAPRFGRVVSAVLLGLSVASAAYAGSPYASGLFQLGDGQEPAGFGGAAAIVGSDEQAAPDWGDLFDAEGRLTAAVAPGTWAVFIADDVSRGIGFEGSALAGSPKLVRNGSAAPDVDLGNAYLYGATDAAGALVVFVGLERLSGGDGVVDIELTQALVRLGHGGFGRNVPWPVEGESTLGDALLRLEFSGGKLTATVFGWGGSGWLPLAATGEGCDAGESICAIGNAASIDGGPWVNHGDAGESTDVDAGRFVEVGLSLGALLGANPTFQSVLVRTPGDIAFGYLPEGN